MNKQLFMNLFVSSKFAFGLYGSRVRVLPPAIAHKKDNGPAFLYSCVARALVHKRSRQICGPHFRVYSCKFAYRPIGQRGDPLKIVLYRIFIDIAKENATAGPFTS